MPSMPNGAMTRTVYDTARSNFRTHFRLNGTDPVLDTLQHFAHADLAALVAVINKPYHLVLVHYGLENDAMRYGFGFSFGTQVPGTDSYVYAQQDYPTHVLSAGSFIPINHADWDVLRNNYTAKLQVKRDDAGTTGFGPLISTDALRAVFPWEAELDPLYLDNLTAGPGDYRMAVDCLSLFHEPEANEEGTRVSPKGYRHGVGFHVEVLRDNAWEAMLSDDAQPAPYLNRAADYGNLCPVQCNIYTEV